MRRRSEPIKRPLIGRANRRQVLAGLAAAVILPETASAMLAHERERGAMTMIQQAEDTATGTYLTVPGARLYYEVSGAGPVLLFIPGGPADAEGFAANAELLAEHYTVVRYDPRGISRSRIDGLVEDVPVAVHADDAALLLQALGDEPAYVLGHSGGAVIGLALVERHPALVQTYVAHEPPLVELLPEDSPYRGGNQEIYDIYLAEGPGPAMAKFMSVAGFDEQGPPPADMDPAALEDMATQMARMEENLDFFFGHYLMPITSYVPDIAALQAGSTRVVVGVGEESVGQETYDTSLALADRLGSEPAVFPGDHVGSMMHPAEWSQTLHDVLQAR